MGGGNLTFHEAADLYWLEGAAKIGAGEDYRGVADTRAQGDLVLLEDALINQDAHGLGETKGRDGSGLVAGALEDLFFGSHGDAGEAEMVAQGRPGYLIWTRDQDHDEIIGIFLAAGNAEDDAADNLLRALAALNGGLLKGFDRVGMGKDAVGNGKAIKVTGNGSGVRWMIGHWGIIKRLSSKRRTENVRVNRELSGEQRTVERMKNVQVNKEHSGEIRMLR
jgi:hypothetical protein